MSKDNWDIIRAKYVASAVRADQYPQPSLIEAAFIGRSNVGKSSLINSLCRRVSNEPLIPCGAPGTWNSSESGHPYAFRDDDGRVFLFYQGSSDNGKTWYISRKEVHFGSSVRILTSEVDSRESK